MSGWRSRALFVLGWFAVNALSFGVIGAAFHNFPLGFTLPPSVRWWGNFEAGAALFGLALGTLPAIVIGAVQWPLVRRVARVARVWVMTNALAVGVVHFVLDGFSSASDLSLMLLVGGAVAGGWQGWLLRAQGVGVTRAWVVASVAGWYLGGVLGMVAMRALGLLEQAWSPGLGFWQHGVVGLGVGLGYAVLTGVILVRRASI